MTTPHSDIPQCNNSNEPEEMNQSEEKVQPAHCHMQMSSPLCTDCVAIQYPSDITTESARKNYKQKLLKDNPEILFADSFKTGEFCNLIFFTDHPNIWHKAIINHYPSVKKEGICNGWKVKIREPCDPDNIMITVNIYKNGTVMVQGHLKTFQTDYSAIMKLEKALLSERLSSEQNTQSSNTDLKPIPAESPAQDPSSPLLKSIPVLQEHFTRLEMEMVQLRENRTQTGASHWTPAKLRAHHTETVSPHTASQELTDRERQLSERAGHTETPATGQRASHTRDEAAAERVTGGERAAAQWDPGPERAAERDTRGERGERAAAQWDPGPERAAERAAPDQTRTRADPQSSNTAPHPRDTHHSQPAPREIRPRQLTVITAPRVKCPSTTPAAPIWQQLSTNQHRRSRNSPAHWFKWEIHRHQETLPPTQSC